MQSHEQRAASGVLEIGAQRLDGSLVVDQQPAREVAVQEAFHSLAGHMINL